jgi:transposase
MAIALKVVPDMMVPPVSWRRFMDEVHRYLTTVAGVADDSALAVVLEVQHALLPARGRSFPIRLELAHDYAAWHRAVAERRDAGDRRDWHLAVEPLRSYGSAPFDIDDPLESCERNLGGTYAFLSEDSAWDLESPVARPRQAMNDIPITAEA